MPRAEDPRPAKTKAAVVAAVEALTARRVEVTVQTLVAESGVSRSSIYAQFGGLDGVAVAILTDAFADIESLDLRLRASATAIETARATTARLVDEFSQRRALYAGVLASDTTARAYRAVQRAFADQALPTFKATVPAGVDAAVAAEYVAGGTMAVLAAWLLSDTPAPKARVQEDLISLLPAWLSNDERTSSS